MSEFTVWNGESEVQNSIRISRQLANGEDVVMTLEFDNPGAAMGSLSIAIQAMDKALEGKKPYEVPRSAFFPSELPLASPPEQSGELVLRDAP